jgi:hypothetical protein
MTATGQERRFDRKSAISGLSQIADMSSKGAGGADLVEAPAQRIHVRIKLGNVPPDLLLVAGRTATVSIGGSVGGERGCV